MHDETEPHRAAGARRAPYRLKTPLWERRYGAKLIATDFVIVVAVVFGVQLLRFGVMPADLATLVASRSLTFSYSALSCVLICGWLAMLAVNETRKPQNFGTGSSEYRRVVTATFATFGMFAVLAYLLRVEIGRGYLLLALPIGLVMLIAERWLWRKRLHSQRRHGRNVYRTMLVGEKTKVKHLRRQMKADQNAGFHVVAIATNARPAGHAKHEGIVVCSYDELLVVAENERVDTVIITGSDDLPPEHLQSLGWDLDDRGIDLVVTAALTDIAGPRIHMRQAVGFPLMFIDYPKLTGAKKLVKRVSDVLGSTLLLLVLSPVMLAAAVSVKLSGPGPIFYSQERVGEGGKPFAMFKFRSMVPNADDQLASLLDAQGTNDKPLHKIHNDPRITPVGRVLRRYSLDELPQLVNVLIGTMSLVGPRPQREAEVALYEERHYRRLRVKPGITGLWQVSGRSSLDWTDAIRLDLYYVENWSLVGDLVILWRTVRAVVSADGAN